MREPRDKPSRPPRPPSPLPAKLPTPKPSPVAPPSPTCARSQLHISWITQGYGNHNGDSCMQLSKSTRPRKAKTCLGGEAAKGTVAGAARVGMPQRCLLLLLLLQCLLVLQAVLLRLGLQTVVRMQAGMVLLLLLLLLPQRILLLLLQQTLLRKCVQLLGCQAALQCQGKHSESEIHFQVAKTQGGWYLTDTESTAHLTCDSCCSCATLRP